jgi:hypothetical protein
MPENAVFELSTEDITQPTWDELTRSMLEGDPDAEGDEPDMLTCGGDSCTGTADTGK